MRIVKVDVTDVQREDMWESLGLNPVLMEPVVTLMPDGIYNRGYIIGEVRYWISQKLDTLVVPTEKSEQGFSPWSCHSTVVAYEEKGVGYLGWRHPTDPELDQLLPTSPPVWKMTKPNRSDELLLAASRWVQSAINLNLASACPDSLLFDRIPIYRCPLPAASGEYQVLVDPAGITYFPMQGFKSCLRFVVTAAFNLHAQAVRRVCESQHGRARTAIENVIGKYRRKYE